MKIIRKLLSQVKKADKNFNLINSQDKICIGISGGKDSMSLFYLLDMYKRYSKIDYEIFPCLIDLGFPNNDFKEIKKYFSSKNYNLEIIDGKDVYSILKEHQQINKTNLLSCSICSKMKKSIIDNYAQKINCNKVAFGHHVDDALETLLLNQIYGGKIETFSPKMHLSKDNITFIRPLILTNEDDLKLLCEEENIPLFLSNCPNDKKTKREDIKNVLKDIYKNYSTSQTNFENMLLNYDKLDLFFSHQEIKLENSEIYFKIVRFYNDLIEEINYFDNKNYEINNDLKHLIFYENNKIIGLIYLYENIENKIFKIDIKKINDKKNVYYFVKEIINILYFKYNPYIITSNNIIYLQEFKKLNFILDNNTLILKVNNKIK